MHSGKMNIDRAFVWENIVTRQSNFTNKVSMPSILCLYRKMPDSFYCCPSPRERDIIYHNVHISHPLNTYNSSQQSLIIDRFVKEGCKELNTKVKSLPNCYRVINKISTMARTNRLSNFLRHFRILKYYCSRR